MNVPATIRSALGGRLRRVPVGVRMPVSRGQVRAVRSPRADPASDRMVLVVRVESRREFAEVMLVHPYPEIATDADLVVSPRRSTMPYWVVVETDTRAVVWLYQLDRLIGEVCAGTLEAVGDVAVGVSPVGAGLSTGVGLRGRFDPRWEFKAQEGAAVRSLAGGCTSWLLSDGHPLQLDPGVLVPGLLSGCDDSESAVLNLVDAVARHGVMLDLDDVGVLEDVGALSEWVDEFGPSGHDMYESLRPLVDRALSTGSLPVDLTAGSAIGEWANKRKVEAGSFFKRAGCDLVSASYVRSAGREASIRLAQKHNIRLIDV